jgi:hypothetical protein
MKVSMFRVEKQCGTGPYMADDDNPLLKHMMSVHGDADHPEPWDDSLLGEIYPDEVCGFPTLCGLEEWFAGYEDPLSMAGYSIGVYSVPVTSVRYGHKQAVFVRGDLHPVRRMSMF